jgi:hypothetical protein
MKYLKFFEIELKNENFIKQSNSIAINHMLRDFSKKLEDIIIAMQDLNTEVRRYFREDGTVSIIYEESHGGKFLRIELMNDSKNIELRSYLYIRNKNPKNENCRKFYDFINYQLKKYFTDDNKNEIFNTIYLKNVYLFPITKLNNVLKKLEKYYINIDSNKYNL